jgi:hypothetical protein
MEVIFVQPLSQKLQLDESELKCFHSWHIVEVDAVISKARGYVAGIRHAKAPVIVLTEDHSFPDPNWAETLIAAHEQPWAIVGPSVRIADPSNAISWADFYQAYGQWTPPISTGAVRQLPGHNSSYKRDILLAYGSDLEDLMEAENILHLRIVEQGYELLLESGTSTSHLNFDSYSSWIPKRYYTGRQFAFSRAKTWSWPRRLFYSLASPLIPCVRLWRIQKNIQWQHSTGFHIRLLSTLFLGLMVEGLGYMIGFVVGAGKANEKLEKYEYNR